MVCVLHAVTGIPGWRRPSQSSLRWSSLGACCRVMGRACVQPPNVRSCGWGTEQQRQRGGVELRCRHPSFPNIDQTVSIAMVVSVDSAEAKAHLEKVTAQGGKVWCQLGGASAWGLGDTHVAGTHQVSSAATAADTCHCHSRDMGPDASAGPMCALHTTGSVLPGVPTACCAGSVCTRRRDGDAGAQCCRFRLLQGAASHRLCCGRRPVLVHHLPQSPVTWIFCAHGVLCHCLPNPNALPARRVTGIGMCFGHHRP